MLVFIFSIGRLVARSRQLVIAICLATSTPFVFAASEEGSGLAVSWRLLENIGENRFLAELNLTNQGSVAVIPPWSLYFNTSAKLDTKQFESPLRLDHINGDLYAIRAESGFRTIEPGDKHTVSLNGSPWAINVSDAPSGFYLVREDKDGHESTPEVVSRRIDPFPEHSKIRRGSGDAVPVVTAAARFAANEQVYLLPEDELPPVIPTPAAFRRLAGSVIVDASTMIIADAGLSNEVQQLEESFQRTHGLTLRQQHDPGDDGNSIRLRLGSVSVDGAAKLAGDEAYTVKIEPGRGIEIVGTDSAGVFYGIQTLRGLVPLSEYQHPGKSIRFDAVEIADAPRFGYRGLHLDVARNFQSTATVKKLLAQMSFYKLNRFHWHLTDDEGWRVEIKSLPELTAIGGRRGHTKTEADRLIPSYGSGPFADKEISAGTGFYTQEEFVDILRYAADRHIVVIPEIDVPGHARAAIKAMAARASRLDGAGDDLRLTDPEDRSQYESIQSWRDNVIDVGRESTYEFLKVVVQELARIYALTGVPLEIVHLGGDEVPRGAWEASPACRDIPATSDGLTRSQQLQTLFLKRASQLVAHCGASAAAWDDCLLFAIEDANWSKRPIAYVWNSVPGWGHEDTAYRLANAGFEVVLSNATHLYFDLAYEKDPQENGYYWAGFVDNRAPFDFNPFDSLQDVRANSMGQPLDENQFSDTARLTDEGRKRILGIQGQLWGENLRNPQLLEYMAFPRVLALAERVWSPEPGFVRIPDSSEREVARDTAWNVFANALGQRELPRLRYVSGPTNYRIPPPGVIVRKGTVDANVAFPGMTIHYSDDGTEPTRESPQFQAPLESSPLLRLRKFDSNGHGSCSAILQ